MGEAPTSPVTFVLPSDCSAVTPGSALEGTPQRVTSREPVPSFPSSVVAGAWGQGQPSSFLLLPTWPSSSLPVSCFPWGWGEESQLWLFTTVQGEGECCPTLPWLATAGQRELVSASRQSAGEPVPCPAAGGGGKEGRRCLPASPGHGCMQVGCPGQHSLGHPQFWVWPQLHS